MTNLYDIEEGFKIEKTKKKHTIAMILCGVFCLLLVFVLTYFSTHTLIMILDILLVGSYFSYVFTYHSFIKKNLNSKYHLLAKIQHFEHEIINGSITSVDNNIKTIENFEVYTLKINDARTVFIEAKKLDETLKTSTNINIAVVDNFVIGYEVIDNV